MQVIHEVKSIRAHTNAERQKQNKLIWGLAKSLPASASLYKKSQINTEVGVQLMRTSLLGVGGG